MSNNIVILYRCHHGNVAARKNIWSLKVILNPLHRIDGDIMNTHFPM